MYDGLRAYIKRKILDFRPGADSYRLRAEKTDSPDFADGSFAKGLNFIIGKSLMKYLENNN